VLAWRRELALPGLVAMGLLQGCRNGAEQRRVERILRPYRVYWPSHADCERAFQDYAMYHLRHALGILDALIAETAVGLGVPLATFNDRHYRLVEGVVAASHDHTAVGRQRQGIGASGQVGLGDGRALPGGGIERHQDWRRLIARDGIQAAEVGIELPANQEVEARGVLSTVRGPRTAACDSTLITCPVFGGIIRRFIEHEDHQSPIAPPLGFRKRLTIASNHFSLLRQSITVRQLPRSPAVP
jgi:predicted nucleic acid-binding protein